MQASKLMAILAILAPGGASAQTVPNLSGTWVLQVDKSNYGGLQGPQSRTDVIEHREPKLTIRRTTVAGGQENQATLVYEIDGKPYKNMVGPTEITSTLRWEGNVLVSVTLAPGPQGEVTITDRYELSADGQTLTQLRTLSVQGQELMQTMVLARQQP